MDFASTLNKRLICVCAEGSGDCGSGRLEVWDQGLGLVAYRNGRADGIPTLGTLKLIKLLIQQCNR